MRCKMQNAQHPTKCDKYNVFAKCNNVKTVLVR